VAIEEMGGPMIYWRPGRVDADNGTKTPPDGRLPDASQGAKHVEDVFSRMGFNDEVRLLDGDASVVAGFRSKIDS
jgi:cytochrome c peroxidase